MNLESGQSPQGGPDEVRVGQLLADVLSVNDDSAFARMLMGIYRRQQFRLNDALIELRMAIGLAPNLTWAAPHLGLTLALLGQPDEALPLIERSLRSSEHDFLTPLSHFVRGICHLLLGNTKEAIPSLRIAQVMNPRVYQFFVWLAAALGLKGELDEASAALRHAIEMISRYRLADHGKAAGSLSRVYRSLREDGLRWPAAGGPVGRLGRNQCTPRGMGQPRYG